jgi:quercetin dioxygenase-like cupin family protein
MRVDEAGGASIRVRVACRDLASALEAYTGELGFRLDMIRPADAPRIAELSGHGITLQLERTTSLEEAPTGEGGEWVNGRAGMQYRDLVPGRLGGRLIASHIRIPEGGPVPDYVHYHRVGFQMIYCRRGWVRVVYEDQGPPFVMHEGDCVLQPPTIRHRVLEASPGLEVVEVSAPAEHDTWRDHDLVLPTAQVRPQREFGGQRFVRHIASEATWEALDMSGVLLRDTGISGATDGAAGARVLHVAGAGVGFRPPAGEGFRFLFVLEGRLELRGGADAPRMLAPDDACLVPDAAELVPVSDSGGAVLEVCMPASRH